MTGVRACFSIGPKEVQGAPAILGHSPRAPGLIHHLILTDVSVALELRQGHDHT